MRQLRLIKLIHRELLPRQGVMFQEILKWLIAFQHQIVLDLCLRDQLRVYPQLVSYMHLEVFLLMRMDLMFLPPLPSHQLGVLIFLWLDPLVLL